MATGSGASNGLWMHKQLILAAMCLGMFLYGITTIDDTGQTCVNCVIVAKKTPGIHRNDCDVP